MTKKSTKKVASENNGVAYSQIRKIVWAFADLCRDKGNGTVEDYAKIVIPTCLVKRVLDLQQEWLEANGAVEFEALDIGVDAHQVLQDINQKSFRFYSNSVTESPTSASVVLLGWKHLVDFADNPNAEVVTIPLSFGQQYSTQARNFVELMFEVIRGFNEVMQHVFATFEFKALLLQKEILPYADYYKTCHEELSSMSFTMAKVPTDMFSDTYMDLVGRFAHDSGKKGGEFFTPTPLVKNAWRFIDIDSYAEKLVRGEKTSLAIGDPTAGSNTFLVYGYDLISHACEKLSPGTVSKEAFQFYGQELKAFQYCLGLVNMIFHGTLNQYNQGIGDFRCQNANVISEYNTGIGKMRGKLDIVVANPPYGTSNYGIEYAQASQSSEPRWSVGVPLKSEGEFAFLQTIVDLLNKQGKAVVVMPLGTLFRGAAAKFRKALLEDDVLEGLVTLPGNMFLTTQIPVVLWILNKNKASADKGKVFMVNASSDFVKVGKFHEWQPEKAIEAYLGRDNLDGYSGHVSSEVLEKNHHNLSVQRYFSVSQSEKLVNLAELNLEIEALQSAIAANKSEIDDFVTQALRFELSADVAE
jgi:type I restriction enzyme M protein